MKTLKIMFYINLLVMCLFTMSACRRTSDDVWEDTKTASRHVGRGVRALGGKHGDSRQIRSRDDFVNDDDVFVEQESEFIPLQDEQASGMICMEEVARPPRETPGEPGSSIPGIAAFRDPAIDPRLAPIFRNIQFEYNSNLIKGEDNLNIVKGVADFLKKHSNVYVFVEGHADERGPEAYNLALGARRSNAVRNTLIKEGVNPDNIFTISYGKERPLILEHHEEAWGQNRRAEFKVYER